MGLSDVAVTTGAWPGFVLKRPDVLDLPAGLQVHGALCRRLSWAKTPGRVQVERLDLAGRTISDLVQPLRSVSRIDRQCVFYTVATPWRLEAGQSLRVSVK